MPSSSSAQLPAALTRPLQALARWLWGGGQVLFVAAQLMVLALSPSSYSPPQRARMAHHLVAGTASLLAWFTGFAALVTLVLTRIVVVTAESYGLTQYALQVVIRVLVIELIPLCAVLFVALRSTLASAEALARLRREGVLAEQRLQGRDPLLTEGLPRALAGLHASLTLAALSCVVAVLLAYLAVYGLSPAALPGYTRLFGQIFNGPVTLIFVLKTFLFSLAVAFLPVASALYEHRPASDPARDEAGMLSRLFMVLLAIELLCLVGNYY